MNEQGSQEQPNTRFAKFMVCPVCDLILSPKMKKLREIKPGLYVHKSCHSRWKNTIERAIAKGRQSAMKGFVQEYPDNIEGAFTASGKEEVKP